MREIRPDWVPPGTPRMYQAGAANNPSLASGRAGVALLHAYLALTRTEEPHARRALKYMEEAIDAVAQQALPVGLYAGFPGIAWVAAHLRQVLLGSDTEDPNAAIDEALLDYLREPRTVSDFDLVRGLAGLGVYALERQPRDAAIACLEHVVRRLEDLAVRTDQGVAWRTPPELLPPDQRAACPQGYYNLGVAHGVPGVIALLGAVHAVGLERARVRVLLDGAVQWLLAQRLPDERASRFPNWVAPGVAAIPARLAWCYGDAGIAAALLRAARDVGVTDWEQAALDIARRAAQRRGDDTGVVDAGLCHGAAGVGHLFNRMFQASGDGQLADAARFWFERTLAMQHAGQGIGGFSAWMRAPDGEQGWVADPYFLTGATGVALALLSASTTVEPVWDRVLLAAIPPQLAEQSAAEVL